MDAQAPDELARCELGVWLVAEVAHMGRHQCPISRHSLIPLLTWAMKPCTATSLGLGRTKDLSLHVKEKAGVLATEAEATWRVGDKSGTCWGRVFSEVRPCRFYLGLHFS